MELIGKKIKRKRLLKKYSLEYVSSELKISKDVLKSIEDNRFQSGTNNAFLIGHIRSYSTFLGLNALEIVEKFKIENDYSKIDIKDQIQKPITYNSLNKIGIASFALIIIIFASFYYFFIKENHSKLQYALIPDVLESMNPVIEETIMNEQINQSRKNNEIFNKVLDNVSSSSVIAAQNSKNLEDINEDITLKFLNPTWIQIRDINDTILISKLMQKDDEYTYSLNSNYYLTAGNAGNIIVLIGNKVHGKVGKFGEVVDSLSINSDFNN